MAENFTLTEGALERIHNASGTDDEALSSSPTVQILTLKKFSGREGQSNPNAPDRYRLILSDGKNFAQAMLATQLSHLVDENQLKKGCIITLDKVTCNALQGKKQVHQRLHASLRVFLPQSY
jgi:replication factor A1